jgi:formate dehydrogenase maturation protein FdhE
MATPRTHCPYCNSRAIEDLAEVLHHVEADFFRCLTCRAMWHVPKGENWPPSQSLLGKKETDAT